MLLERCACATVGSDRHERLGADLIVQQVVDGAVEYLGVLQKAIGRDRLGGTHRDGPIRIKLAPRNALRAEVIYELLDQIPFVRK